VVYYRSFQPTHPTHWLTYAQVARVVVASVVAIMSTFVTYIFPMIYGSVRPNFWRKRSMVFLVPFIVDSVVNDLCLMAVAFVDVKEDEKTSAAAVPIHPAPDFDSPLGLLRRDSSFKLPGLT
jgi:hypothetical protein